MAAGTPRCKSPYADACQLQIQYSYCGSTPSQTLARAMSHHVIIQVLACLTFSPPSSSRPFLAPASCTLSGSLCIDSTLQRSQATMCWGRSADCGLVSRLPTISLHAHGHTSGYSSRLLQHRTSATTGSAEYPSTARLCHIHLGGTSG